MIIIIIIMIIMIIRMVLIIVQMYSKCYIDCGNYPQWVN